MNSSYKLLKLKELLQNSKSRTFISENPLINFSDDISKTVSPQSLGVTLSKDLSLYLSLIEKPINLMFSMDQFVFEFSKKTYQQKKTGEFFQQLKERKKLSFFYGDLTKKQLVNIFNKVKNSKGSFSKNVFSQLERRLDVLLYRSGLTRTISEARQLIKHEKIFVNKKIMNIPSFLLNPGDVIEITQKTKEILNTQLLNLVTLGKFRDNKRHYPKIAGDFYSKFTKTLNKRVDKFGKSNLSAVSSFNKLPVFYQSKVFCNFLIQFICRQIKLRTYWNINKNKISFYNRIREENKKKCPTYENLLLTVLKWKSIPGKKNFRKFTNKLLGKNSSLVSKRKNSQKNFYANQGCLQKKPLFWNRKFSFLKNKKIESTLNSQSLPNNQISYYQSDKKHLKSLNLKKQNLVFYRKSFLLFLKHLENSPKFTNLVSLNMKKALFKKYSSKSWFSKKLTFRVIKPMHIEISYSLLNLAYLYSPQRLNFPFPIDIDLIYRSLR